MHVGLSHLIIYLISAVFAVALMRRYVYGFSERTLRDVIPFIRRLLLEDLQNLLHPDVEDHIRTTASRQQFKRTQWKRIKLTLQYLGDLGENAAIFYAWGKYERKLSIRFPDPERKRASVELITACVQSRFCVFRMRLTLHCWLIRMAFLPFLAPPTFKDLERRGSFDVFAFYDQVKKAAGELSMAYGQRFYDELLQVL
ncbi:MAG TPA: hypothetical protein VHQ22_13095 [Terriglobales bacterium]|jgi:hypothetical protein|nr:hypothetical protein [Terriglobales bacterium]